MVGFEVTPEATGRETASSDVDVMVVGEKISVYDVVAILAEAQRDVGREVTASVYRTEEFCRKLAQGQHFLSSVVSGAKVFLIGDQGELTDWLGFGWLKEHQTSRHETADLFAVRDSLPTGLATLVASGYDTVSPGRSSGCACR